MSFIAEWASTAALLKSPVRDATTARLCSAIAYSRVSSCFSASAAIAVNCVSASASSPRIIATWPRPIFARNTRGRSFRRPAMRKSNVDDFTAQSSAPFLRWQNASHWYESITSSASNSRSASRITDSYASAACAIAP